MADPDTYQNIPTDVSILHLAPRGPLFAPLPPQGCNVRTRSGMASDARTNFYYPGSEHGRFHAWHGLILRRFGDLPVHPHSHTCDGSHDSLRSWQV